MPAIPAFCDTCGTIFASGFSFENCREITLSGCGAGPCPKCGGTGHVPDGVYNFLDNTIEVLSAPKRTIKELSELLRIIQKAHRDKINPESIQQTIRDQGGEFASIADVLPKTRSELYGFLAILITIIQMLIQHYSKPSPANVIVNNVFNQIYASNEIQVTADKPTPVRSKKIGRNEQCPCGSNKKYKKCCGASR